MSGTLRPAALGSTQVPSVCSAGDSAGQRTAAAGLAWASLMDPAYRLQASATTTTEQASSAAPGSEQGAVFKSAGVAVSLPRPALLDEPDHFEGSSHD